MQMKRGTGCRFKRLRNRRRVKCRRTAAAIICKPAVFPYLLHGKLGKLRYHGKIRCVAGSDGALLKQAEITGGV